VGPELLRRAGVLGFLIRGVEPLGCGLAGVAERGGGGDRGDLKISWNRLLSSGKRDGETLQRKGREVNGHSTNENGVVECLTSPRGRKKPTVRPKLKRTNRAGQHDYGLVV